MTSAAFRPRSTNCSTRPPARPSWRRKSGPPAGRRRCLHRQRAAALRPRRLGAADALLPDADLPVVQLSLPASAGPAETHALGAALAGLRDEGVLIVGSGSMTHNLGEFRGGTGEATDFSRWIESRLQAQDLPALLDYRARAPSARRAHPSEEHFMPLYFALGAAGAMARPRYLSREVMYSILAMDAMAFEDAQAA
ncbi:Cilia- and flagella-associated protein 52 [Manis javanica]|nr:Cilia- and flagella-associated protein 52 [Manis javanica]